LGCQILNKLSIKFLNTLFEDIIMISVITPCKNIISEGREEFFRKLMTTLHEQTYQDFEHIVVDSDSKDGTAELLQEYVRLGQIDKLISEKDNNLHEAMNKGLKIAKGEFIYIANTDNYFATKFFFEKSIDAIKKHNVDFTHADRIIIKRDGSEPSIKKGDERVAFFRMPFRYQTMLLKKELYDKFGPLDEKYKIASDYKFMMKIILEGKKGYYFPEVLIYTLDGGITRDRELCIKEVSQVLYECYGKKYKLTVKDCNDIYLRRITPILFSKLLSNIKNKKIIDSLTYCYKKVQPTEENIQNIKNVN
jgi:glycosyltransferase involved in cell wall biosynthesis